MAPGTSALRRPKTSLVDFSSEIASAIFSGSRVAPTLATISVPVNAVYSAFQSTPSGACSTGDPGCAIGGGEEGAEAGARLSSTFCALPPGFWPSSAAFRLSSISAGAAAGCRLCCKAPNILRTSAVAAKITSMSSALKVNSRLRSLSNKFSVRWHSVTSSLALRNPAPPLMVWKPLNISLSSLLSSGRFSKSINLLSTSDSISPASIKKSLNNSSMPAKSFIFNSSS